MAIRMYHPTTPSRRGMTSPDVSMLSSKRPLKTLLSPRKQRSGRNNQGKVTMRHRGGGAKRFYRHINFSLPVGTVATVEQIEYDPNRSARIARVVDDSGKRHYIIAAQGLKIGQVIHSGNDVGIKTGNRLPLSAIPLGAVVHNIELRAGSGGQLVRSAGLGAQLVAKEGVYAQLKLPSGEVRLVDIEAQASLGVVGNDQHQNVKLGNAGRRRRKGRRPHVRGIVMNAADHPHGGGEGKGKGGNNPRSPWGQPTLGYKTRKPRSSDRLIVKSRHAGKRG